MHNSDNYVHYNGYDEDDGRNKIGLLGWIVIAFIVFFLISTFSLVGSCVNTYNKLVEMEEDVNLAFANVQTAMQSRLEKIPDLVEVADEAAEHIETIIGDVSDAREALGSCTTPEELDAANAEITNQINEFLVVVENYPTITASDQYNNLMDQIEGAVNRIGVAREDYNVAVNEYNKLVRRFPSSLLANMFGFETKEEFKADEAANNSSLVDFGD